MVALTHAPTTAVRLHARPTWPEQAWAWIGVALVALGPLARLQVGHGDVGSRSAALLMLMIGLAVWLAVNIAGHAHAATAAVGGLMVPLVLGGFPARADPPYDERVAVYDVNQTLAAQIPPARPGSSLVVLVEPVYSGDQPRFSMAADLGTDRLSWACDLTRGRQRLVLPLTRGIDDPQRIALRLDGSPRRDGDYLLVYQSARRGGPLVDVVAPDATPTPASDALPVTRCRAS